MSKIIADACLNHLGNKQIIEHMIKSASECGVDFIKFQAFQTKHLNVDEPFWRDKYEYYNKLQLKDDDYKFIVDKCRQYKILPMFTVFHKEVIPILVDLDVFHCKIASPDADNYRLINECILSFDDVFISTGMGVPDFKYSAYYFYCVSRYPAPYSDIDFDKMPLFDGFSDHTENIISAKKAIDLGVKYIERHFTLGKYLPGNDHLFSSTPDEFKELCSYRDYKNKCKLYKKRWR
jgi:sialic acid synthase SpsE